MQTTNDQKMTEICPQLLNDRQEDEGSGNIVMHPAKRNLTGFFRSHTTQYNTTKYREQQRQAIAPAAAKVSFINLNSFDSVKKIKLIILIKVTTYRRVYSDDGIDILW